MTTQKRIIIIACLVLLTGLILRETGVINIEYNRNNITGRTNGRLNNLVIAVPWANNSTWQNAIKGNCNFNGSISNCPIAVTYNNTTYGDTSACRHISIDVYSISTGALWMPFYRSASFTARASCSHLTVLANGDSSNPILKSFNMHGNFTVTGHVSVYGFTSYKNAKKLVTDFVLKQVYLEAKNLLKTQ